MIPYDNFTFFLWLLIPVVPAIILGLTKASPKVRSLWIMHLCLVMLFFILRPLLFFIQAVIYFIWEYIIVISYLHYRKSEIRKNKTYVFYLIIVASLIPLMLVKFVPLVGQGFVQTLLSHLGLSSLPTINYGRLVQTAHSLGKVVSGQIKGAAKLSVSAVPSGSKVLTLSKAAKGFSASNQGQMAPVWNSVLGFLGISYVTFRIVGTIIEIRDGLIKEVNFGEFISFVFFFPTLASGPIDRYRRFLADLKKNLSRQEYVPFMVEGIEYVMRGFLYKFIIAYLINKYAMVPLNHTKGMWPTVQYMYVYSAYLFFDFAGYSSFAIGVSRFYGIKTPENFNAPFWAKNIKDFWNRWHISLSMWFRDFIYMRFVLDSAKKKRFTNRYTASAAGYLLLFLLMGIWHGTQLQYIIYGLYMAVLMIGFEFLERLNKKQHFWGEGKAWDMLARFCTMQFVCFGLLIFSGRLFQML